MVLVSHLFSSHLHGVLALFLDGLVFYVFRIFKHLRNALKTKLSRIDTESDRQFLLQSLYE
jgi:hypothetical protein